MPFPQRLMELIIILNWGTCPVLPLLPECAVPWDYLVQKFRELTPGITNIRLKMLAHPVFSQLRVAVPDRQVDLLMRLEDGRAPGRRIAHAGGLAVADAEHGRDEVAQQGIARAPRDHRLGALVSC